VDRQPRQPGELHQRQGEHLLALRQIALVLLVVALALVLVPVELRFLVLAL